MYIEYVIIDNFIINFLLLKSAMASSRVKTGKLKLIISSVLGTVVAVIMPLFSIDNGFLILIKINLGLVMVLIAGEYLTVKKMLIAFCYFLLFTFLSGGLIIGLFCLAGVDYIVYFSVNYNSFMPVGISVLLVYLFTKLTLYLIYNLLKARDIKPFIRKCIIVISGKKFKVNGYIDNSEAIEELREELEAIEERGIELIKADEEESAEYKALEEAEQEKREAIEELEREQDEQREIYQYYIISDNGAHILKQCTNEIVYYIPVLDVYVWGVTRFGTSWDYVLTDIKIDVEV